MFSIGFPGKQNVDIIYFFNIKTLTEVFTTNYCTIIVISRMTVRTKRMLTLNIDRDRICTRQQFSLVECSLKLHEPCGRMPPSGVNEFARCHSQDHAFDAGGAKSTENTVISSEFAPPPLSSPPPKFGRNGHKNNILLPLN